MKLHGNIDSGGLQSTALGAFQEELQVHQDQNHSLPLDMSDVRIGGKFLGDKSIRLLVNLDRHNLD